VEHLNTLCGHIPKSVGVKPWYINLPFSLRGLPCVVKRKRNENRHKNRTDVSTSPFPVTIHQQTTQTRQCVVSLQCLEILPQSQLSRFLLSLFLFPPQPRKKTQRERERIYKIKPPTWRQIKRPYRFPTVSFVTFLSSTRKPHFLLN